MLDCHRLRLMGRCWAWGLAASWPEQGQDSFSPTLLINGTLIQGCITLCCSLCAHAQPLFHTQCMSPALGRTVSDAIVLIQRLMIVLALVLCGYILSAMTFCLQSAAVTRYVLISIPSLSSSLHHLSFTHAHAILLAFPLFTLIYLHVLSLFLSKYNILIGSTSYSQWIMGFPNS